MSIHGTRLENFKK